jgi:hypothetical protein
VADGLLTTALLRLDEAYVVQGAGFADPVADLPAQG